MEGVEDLGVIKETTFKGRDVVFKEPETFKQFQDKIEQENREQEELGKHIEFLNKTEVQFYQQVSERRKLKWRMNEGMKAHMAEVRKEIVD